MPFQSPVTIADTLRRIQKHELVLPAVQREFVWDEQQIARLFDSILRGYPIGSFLSWKVEPATTSQFKFYGFAREYHQRDNPHCPQLDLPTGQPVTALLDGQQRLTALNIGLRGSYASKLKYKKWTHPQAFPARRLYVNALARAAENDLGLMFDFRMLSEPVAQPTDLSAYWFPVHRLYDISGVGDLIKELAAHNLGNHEFGSTLISRLYEEIHNKALLHFYEEHDQQIDKVLDIFIRVNSGGTKLSHSDLLLSVATAQWDSLDARHEIQSLVDRLNAVGQGFQFTKDVVLKSGLMLTGVTDVSFKVGNFNRKDMKALEDQWEAVSRSLLTAAQLLGGFGLSRDTLAANSVLIPLAYYLHHRGLDSSYCDKPVHKDDRERMRSWTIRALLKSGVWGSGLDSLLAAQREVIEKHGSAGFPGDELEARMASRGKSLAFPEEEIEELLGGTYGWGDTFVTLALVFSHINTRNHHHVDHVYPRSMLTDAKLRAAGLTGQDLDDAVFYRDSITNLQLLPGPENVSKNKSVPAQWADTMTADELSQHVKLKAMPNPLPGSVAEFVPWCHQRYELLKARLTNLLS